MQKQAKQRDEVLFALEQRVRELGEIKRKLEEEMATLKRKKREFQSETNTPIAQLFEHVEFEFVDL